MFIRRRCRLAPLIFFSMLPYLTSPGALAQNGWVGEYASPHGVSLSLHDQGSGRLAGTLTVDGNPLPVQLQMQGSALEGTFESSGTTFPVSITTGEEPDQIVVASEGSIFELARKPGSANPLAARANRPANPLTRPQPAEGRPAVDLSGNFNDPNGYFSMNVPPDWQANMMADDVFELTTARSSSTNSRARACITVREAATTASRAVAACIPTSRIWARPAVASGSPILAVATPSSMPAV